MWNTSRTVATGAELLWRYHQDFDGADRGEGNINLESETRAALKRALERRPCRIERITFYGRDVYRTIDVPLEERLLFVLLFYTGHTPDSWLLSQLRQLASLWTKGAIDPLAISVVTQLKELGHESDALVSTLRDSLLENGLDTTELADTWLRLSTKFDNLISDEHEEIAGSAVYSLIEDSLADLLERAEDLEEFEEGLGELKHLAEEFGFSFGDFSSDAVGEKLETLEFHQAGREEYLREEWKEQRWEQRQEETAIDAMFSSLARTPDE